MATASTPIWAPTPEKMQAAVERLVAVAQPTKIILFGSQARGNADDHSIELLANGGVQRFRAVCQLPPSSDGGRGLGHEGRDSQSAAIPPLSPTSDNVSYVR